SRIAPIEFGLIEAEDKRPIVGRELAQPLQALEAQRIYLLRRGIGVAVVVGLVEPKGRRLFGLQRFGAQPFERRATAVAVRIIKGTGGENLQPCLLAALQVDVTPVQQAGEAVGPSRFRIKAAQPRDPARRIGNREGGTRKLPQKWHGMLHVSVTLDAVRG